MSWQVICYIFKLICVTWLTQLGSLTVTKINQERANQDRTKIEPFFDFFYIFQYSYLKFWASLCNSVVKLYVQNFKSSKNIEKCRRKSKKWPNLALWSWLFLSCLIFVTVMMFWQSLQDPDLVVWFEPFQSNKNILFRKCKKIKHINGTCEKLVITLISYHIGNFNMFF